MRYFFSSMQRGRLRNVLWLTIISLSINIGVLITCVALIRGFESESVDKILHIQGHGRVIPTKSLAGFKTNTQEQNVLVEQVPLINKFLAYLNQFLGIEAKKYVSLIREIPRFEALGVLSRRKTTEGVAMYGCDKDQVEFLLKKYIKSGQLTLEPIGLVEPIIIGYRLGARLQAAVADELTLTIRTRDENHQIPCKVVGIFDYGFAEFDSNTIFVRSKLIGEYFPEQPTYNIIYVNEPNRINEYIDKINNIDPKIYIESWKDRNRSVQEMFSNHIRSIYIIIGLYILSGIIQSMSSLYILLSERSYDIGVLTMLGMSNLQRYSIFVTYGMLISIANTVFGIICGVGLSLLYPKLKTIYESITGYKVIHKDAFWLSDFGTKLLVSDLIQIGIAALFIMFLAMLIASHFVSNSNTIRSMRE